MLIIFLLQNYSMIFIYRHTKTHFNAHTTAYKLIIISVLFPEHFSYAQERGDD